LHGVEETARLGPEAYTETARHEVYAALRNKARQVLAAGHATVIDAVFDRPEERTEIEAVAAELGIAFRGLWLEAEPRKLLDRVAARIGDASDATPAVVRQQLAGDTGALTSSWVPVDAGGHAATTLANAREVLAVTKAQPP
jgi:predicted kinase